MELLEDGIEALHHVWHWRYPKHSVELAMLVMNSAVIPEVTPVNWSTNMCKLRAKHVFLRQVI